MTTLHPSKGFQKTTGFQWALGVVLVLFGLCTALASVPALSEPARLFIDLMVWPLDGKQSLAAPEARLLSAILGGVLVGWGVTLLKLTKSLDQASAPTIIHAMRSGILTWFAVDSTGSILAGSPLNAVVNIGIAATLLVFLGRITTKSHDDQ